MAIEKPKIIWQDALSVNVKVIDEQHKAFINIINELIDCINTVPDKIKVANIIERITSYKSQHFATEEKYFQEFNYADAVEHIAAHRSFNAQVEVLSKEYGKEPISFAFALVDFLEDWLLDHLQNMDRKYIQCFHEHGLH